jgi:hypothetical protein
MAKRRYAHAIVSRRNIAFDEWMEELRDQHEGAVPKDFVHRTAKTILRKCDPKQYLLSHATIVASVDTYAPKGVKTGRLMNRGCQIDVRWPEFRIKPECHNIINNNGDAWERSLLLATYRTFIGAHNYLEHIQLPELSKGFIVDAIARDLGNSCYIDILVATDRKHNQLVSDILSGAITGLSMGCHVPGTLVYLSDGSPINIEDVRPGMEVMTQKGNSRRVDNLQIRENRWNVQTIKAVGLPPVTSTDNHNYYIVRRETLDMVRTRSGCGHKSKPRVVEKDYAFDYAEAGTARVGDFLAFPISQDTLEADVSLTEARLLGLWVGDGWKFEYTHDSTVGVGFCLDESHPEIVEDAIRSLDQVAWAAREYHMAVGGAPIKPQSTSRSSRRGAAYITNTSRAFRRLVDSHVSGRNSSEKLIGKTIMSWPREHQMAFLSGLIDSDGCVSTSKRGTKNVFLSTRNLKLAHQYMQLAARCGIVPTFSAVERPGTRLLHGAAGVDYQIKLRNSDVVRVPSVKVRSALAGIKSTQAGRNSRWITDKYVYSEIKKVVRSEYQGFVYDLQVDGDHSYVANGVGVSNCISLFTACTKCGNVAADDAQLCPCVLYDGKLSTFIDETGREQILAEVIGHVSVPNSNQFIEASWVRNPAFRGAVRRNILNPDASAVSSQMQASKYVYELRQQIPEMDGIKKAASVQRRAQQGQEEQSFDDVFGGQDQGGQGGQQGGADESQQGGGADQAEEQGGQDQGQGGQGEQDQGGKEPSKPAKAKPDKIDGMLDKITEQLLTSITNKLEEKLAPKPEDVGTATPMPANLEAGNDSLVRSSQDFTRILRKKFGSSPRLVQWAEKAYKTVHEGGIAAIRRANMTPRELIILSWIEDRCRDRNYPPSLYKAVMQAGPSSSYPTTNSFIAACKMKVGRELTAQERRFLEWKGRIASVNF